MTSALRGTRRFLDNTQKKKRAVRIDRYCRVIFPVIFGIASIATFAHPRG
jgi:hypothetical protein